MAFTRYHDDDCRIYKTLEEVARISNYNLDVPGNGLTPVYMNDPYIRLQKWGGNLASNNLLIDENLRGLDRRLNRDCPGNNYTHYNINPEKINCPKYGMYTDQPRTSNPAWNLRGIETQRFNILLSDPQKTCEIPFSHGLHSRIIEKDNYNNKLKSK